MHEFHQHASRCLRVYEGDVVTGGSPANASGCEANSLSEEEVNGRGEVVDPEPDVVQSG